MLSWRLRRASIVRRYCSVLAQHPYTVVLSWLLVSALCITVALVQHPLPSIINSLTYVLRTRGTEMARRSTAYKVLQNSTVDAFQLKTTTAEDVSDVVVKPIQNRTHSTQRSSRWTCGVDDQRFGPRYTSAVFSSVEVSGSSTSSLFTIHAVRSMCQVEASQLQNFEFEKLCVRDRRTGMCCDSWSLPRYVALLNNRSSCHQIRPKDVDRTLALLQRCSKYYHTDRLYCDLTPCTGVPPECTRHDAVYNLLHYILDNEFLPLDNPSQTHLQFSSTFLPIVNGDGMSYAVSLSPSINDGVTAVVGYNYKLKVMIFVNYLIGDILYLVAASVVLYLVIWAYTESLLITLASIMTVVMSLGLSYFVYTVILDIHVFSFLNLMSVVIISSLGVDEALILGRLWRHCKLRKKTAMISDMVEDVLRHSFLSFIISSTTAAVAFFATIASKVVAISYFSIFAGMTVLAYLVLILTWMPAIAVISERFSRSRWYIRRVPACPTLLMAATFRLEAVFDRLLPYLVVRLRWFWTLALGLLAGIACVAVFYSPGLRMLDLDHYRLLRPSHPVEYYDTHLWRRFNYNNGDMTPPLTVVNVWGVLPTRNQGPQDAYDHKHLLLDPSFNLSHPQSQQWMYNFCQDLRNQTFYREKWMRLDTTCVIVKLRQWMKGRKCQITVNASDYSPCCRNTPFPYHPSVFDRCLIEAIKQSTDRVWLHSVRLNRTTYKPVAVILQYFTTQEHTYSHSKITDLMKRIQVWMDNWRTSAPKGMHSGWYFITDVDTDIQAVVTEEIILVIWCMLALIFIMLLIFIRDLRISLLASITVACIVLMTLAILVLLDWRPHVYDSIAFAIVIGLSADLTMHYSVEYQQCKANREARVVQAIRASGSPIAMTAVASLIMGVCLLPSIVQLYYQVSVFVLVLTVTNWCYSTLFFLPLMSLCGPEEPLYDIFWRWWPLLCSLRITAISSPVVAAPPLQLVCNGSSSIPQCIENETANPSGELIAEPEDHELVLIRSANGDSESTGDGRGLADPAVAHAVDDDVVQVPDLLQLLQTT